MNVLTIGGKVMPRVQKLSVSHEAVWSKNAGRGATGAMIGDIIARKTKLEITFSPMSDADGVLLDTAIAPAFLVSRIRILAQGKWRPRPCTPGHRNTRYIHMRMDFHDMWE